MAKKILLADDSLTIQKVVELTLSGGDYDLLCVSNGQKALESLAEPRPDLILADAVMPGKNGYEVCEAVKGNPATARIPVVLLSGIFEPFDRERAERIGCDLVVSKPFDAQRLVEQIESLLARAASAPPAEPALEEAPFEVPPSGAVESPPEELVPEEEAALLEPAGAIEPELEPAGEPSPVPQVEVDRTVAGVKEPLPPLPEPPRALAPAEEVPVEGGFEEISFEEAEAFFEAPDLPEKPPETSPADPAEPPGPLLPFELTEDQIERIAARVVEKLSDRVVREIAWEVVPDAAEAAVKRRIAELEGGAE